MSGSVDAVMARLRPLPVRLRIAHLAALVRCETDGSSRAAELAQLLSAQAAFRGNRAG